MKKRISLILIAVMLAALAAACASDGGTAPTIIQSTLPLRTTNRKRSAFVYQTKKRTYPIRTSADIIS